jgi:quercetin 2,3-dioxygenase
MKTIYHPSDQRGHADHGWLNAHHSFSFASYYDASRLGFGALRVLNDDIIAAGMGFGAHPHHDMEIITIINQGSLQHKDNLGNGSIITPGEVQVMSAGTGVVHSEFNPSPTAAVNLFQLWIHPKEQNIKPRYDQMKFSFQELKHGMQTLASGFNHHQSLYIHQDAAITMAKIEGGNTLHYTMNKNGNGLYAMVVAGAAEVGGQNLALRDAVGITELNQIAMSSAIGAQLLLIEVPI